MTAQVIQRDRLGVLTKIGQGGQGVVYRAPNVTTKFAASMVYKEYKVQTLADIDFSALAAMPALVEDSLSHSQAERLIAAAAWPCALIEDNGTTSGFVMPAIPDEFFISLTTVKGSSACTAEFQHLLNHPSVLAARGITIDDAQRYSLLREVASTLAFMHQHGVCVGDISPKNLLFSLDPHPAVYFIDCDAMRINGVSVLPQVETPGWQVPAGEELATVYTDAYKLGLLALRLLAGDHDSTNPAHIPQATPDLLRQTITDALASSPHRRPLPDAWTYVLGHAVEHAQHSKKISSAARAAGTGPAPPSIPVVRTRPAAHSSEPPVPPSNPPGQRPQSRRTLSGPQRGLLWAAAVIVIVAVVIASLIMVNASSRETQQPQAVPTVSRPVVPPPAPAPPSSIPAAPGQYTYFVTGTKAPFDEITITYTDASGMRRILPNVYIPWTITLTPLSPSDVGSIEVTSLLRLSKLNCKITASDGTVLSSNENNQPQASC